MADKTLDVTARLRPALRGFEPMTRASRPCA